MAALFAGVASLLGYQLLLGWQGALALGGAMAMSSPPLDATTLPPAHRRTHATLVE